MIPGQYKTHNIGKSSVKIIHVIGLVGSGKSKFIQKFLSGSNIDDSPSFSYPIFDIKEIYEESGFSPEDLKDPKNYSQFNSAIRFSIGNLTFGLTENLSKNLIGEDQNLLIVESSGINKALNESLIPYDRLIIWIKSNFGKNISIIRPYAESLNKVLRKKFEKNEIKYFRF